MSKKLRMLKMKKTSATEISYDVKMKVLQRDKGKCVYCGSMFYVEANAHYIPRSGCGMGIEENIVTLCNNQSINKCHQKFDFGTDEERQDIGIKIEEYLKSQCKNWSEDKVRFIK